MRSAPEQIITHGRVLRIAIPILLANVSVPLLGAVDTAVVGQSPGAAPIAAVGVGAVVISALYWIFGFLRMGTAGLTAQAQGAGAQGEIAALLLRALMIGLAGGLVLIMLQAVLFAGAFYLSAASAEVEGLAQEYMRIRIWSAPAAIALYGVTGWLIALERTRHVLILQLWMNGINMFLDIGFVLGLGWGVEGVALATLIAEGSALILGLYLCREVFTTVRARVFDADRLRHMAVVNGDIMIRSLLLQAIFVSFLLFAGRFGDVPQAANQVLLQFLHIMAYALDGFAFAAEALVGQALGARAASALRRAVILTSLWGLICNLVFSLGFALFGGLLIDLITADHEVREAARAYLPWMVAAPLIGLGAYMLDGIFIGATRTRDMRNMMALSAAVYFIAAYGLMAIWGNHGLWAALLISLITRAVTLAIRYPALEQQAGLSHGSKIG